jgi:hypothetical protein
MSTAPHAPLPGSRAQCSGVAHVGCVCVRVRAGQLATPHTTASTRPAAKGGTGSDGLAVAMAQGEGWRRVQLQSSAPTIRAYGWMREGGGNERGKRQRCRVDAGGTHTGRRGAAGSGGERLGAAGGGGGGGEGGNKALTAAAGSRCRVAWRPPSASTPPAADEGVGA